MLRKTLLFLCFCYQLTNCIVVVGADADDGECDECTAFAESGLSAFTADVKGLGLDPLPISGLMAPCSVCSATGISTAVLTENAPTCSYSSGGGKRIEFKVTVKTFTLTCTCELPCNPKKIIDDFADPVMAGCSAEDIEAGLQTALSGKYPEVGEADPFKAAACAPLAANMECSDDALVTDTAKLTWNDTKIRFTSWVDSKAFVTRLSNVFIEDFTIDSAICGTADPRFERVCKCLLATNFIRNTLVAILARYTECNVTKKLNENQGIGAAQYFKC